MTVPSAYKSLVSTSHMAGGPKKCDFMDSAEETARNTWNEHDHPRLLPSLK